MSLHVARNGPPAMSALSPPSGSKRKLDFGAVRSHFDPTATLAAKFAVLQWHRWSHNAPEYGERWAISSMGRSIGSLNKGGVLD
jgi:hypothetical protein